jgi:hypothetical protein
MDKKIVPYWVVDEYILEVSERKDEILSFLSENCEFSIRPYQRFSNMNFPDEISAGIQKPRCGITYGSIQFVTKTLTETNLYPSSYYDPNRYHLMNYMSEYSPSVFLNKDGFFVSFIWLYKRLSYYQSILGKDIFVRPNSPKKLFTGLVVKSLDDLDLMYKTSSVSDSTMVFISSAKHLEKEIRYFIVDGKVVSHSQYHKDHEICITEDDHPDCRRLAQKVASMTDAFNNTFVCDVGLWNGFPYVVELNCINTSGWYLGDINAIMGALNDKIIRDYREYE